MFKERVHFLMPLAYDRIQGQTGRGSEARCRALAYQVRNDSHYLDSKYVVVLTAGYTKKSPSAPVSSQTESLAEQQAAFMRTLLPQAEYIVNPHVWGTELEISAANEEIEQYCKDRNVDPEQCTVLISSNRMHLFRVKFWCERFMSHQNKQFIEANHHFSVKEIVQESLKLVRDRFSLKYLDPWPE